MQSGTQPRESLNMRPRRECYILRHHPVGAFAREPVGNLVPVSLQRDPALPFTALDCFDQSLRRSGRLLLDLGVSLDLIMPNGRVISQATTHRWKFVADFDEGPVKQALTDLSPLRSLLPFESGMLSKAGLGFLDDDQKMRCRAEVLALTGAGGEEIGIVTLLGLRGYDKALRVLRKHLDLCGGMSLGPDSLITSVVSARVAYNPKPEIALTADHSVFDAANDIIAAYIPVARQNEAGILADLDTELLHDYRIALRKIRSVLSLLKGAYQQEQTAELKAGFSTMMALTGPLRDLDVYLLDERKYYDLLPGNLHAGLDAMFRRYAAERRAAWIKLTRHLRSRRYARDMMSLAQLFITRTGLIPGPEADHAVYSFACGLIWKRYRKIHRIAGDIGAETDDTQIHALRVHCKKLRYLIDFFACLFPGSALKSLLKSLRILQDQLGLFNDLSVRQHNLQNLFPTVGKRAEGSSLDVALSVGALTAVLDLQKTEQRKKTFDAIADFSSSQTERTFRDLFHLRKEAP